jgi:hypothetical protein
MLSRGCAACLTDGWVLAAVAALQVFASQSTRFRSPSAPIAKPDYSCWDNSPESLKGDVTRLGPGSYLKLDNWGAKQQRGYGPRGTTGTAFGSSNKQAHGSLARPDAAVVPGPGVCTNWEWAGLATGQGATLSFQFSNGSTWSLSACLQSAVPLLMTQPEADQHHPAH